MHEFQEVGKYMWIEHVFNCLPCLWLAQVNWLFLVQADQELLTLVMLVSQQELHTGGQ